MSNNIGSNPFLDNLRWPEESNTPEPNSQELTQEDFLSLLTQQLSMQDPSAPVDNDQMISQMASFSTVSGIENLNEGIANLNAVMTSNQALQASGLVGQKVLIPSDTGYISSASPEVDGVVSTPESMGEILITIEGEQGQVVRSFTLDGSEGGNVDVQWDGLDDNGEPVSEGSYTINANGLVDGESQDLPVSTYAHVNSVSLGTADSGAIINLRGMGSILLGDILAVAES